MGKYGFVMSSDNPRFKEQLKQLLNIPEAKFVQCDFGSEMIDNICNSPITQDEAKKHFGIGSQYTIVCGYNGGVAQNHLKVIQSIVQVRDRLPHDLKLILPMTYNATAPYINKIRHLLNDNHLDYIILTDYLSNTDMVFLRKCADMFIHAQNTDANSVSLAEHLLCGNVVINASWLRYENRETYGIPYYLFDNFNELPSVIVKGYNGGSIVSDKLKQSIKEEGWDCKISQWMDVYRRIIK